jgi:hypothetical protein
MLTAALLGAAVAVAVVLGGRSAPDVQRYRRMRAM